MKFELPIGKPQSVARRRTARLSPFLALAIFTIPLYFISIQYSSNQASESSNTNHLEAYNVDISDVGEACTVGFRRCREGEKGGNDREKELKGSTKEPERFKFDEEEEEAQGVTEKLDFETEQGTIKKPENPDLARLEQEEIQKVENDKHIVDTEQPTTKNDGNANKKSSKHMKEMEDYKNSTVQENKRMAVMTFRGNHDRLTVRSRLLDEGKCDIFSGEWVPNPDGLSYTNETCSMIQAHQDCMKFGRPDREFLNWRWKPDNCELALFDPEKFLELVRGKSIAFVGDSIARNHMQSLLCLLSRVALPVDLSKPMDQNQRYEYPKYDFNISMLWSPYLVRTEQTAPNDEKRPFKLFVDEPDTRWTSNIKNFDYLIISGGHWFSRKTYLYINGNLVGCVYCYEPDVSHLNVDFSYRRAFRTALHAINREEGYHGTAFLRTFAPSHFEGGAWDNGGDCVRTRPYKREETAMERWIGEIYLVQLEELWSAQKAGRRNGRRFVLFDATEAMQLRADGHPSKYGWSPEEESQRKANDCVHWCLPGPIDAWNDFLQELLRREIQG